MPDISDDRSSSLVGDPFYKLPALAERLGVKPHLGAAASPPIVSLTTKDGREYDLFDLINALLDRLEAASPDLAGRASGGEAAEIGTNDDLGNDQAAAGARTNLR